MNNQFDQWIINSIINGWSIGWFVFRFSPDISSARHFQRGVCEMPRDSVMLEELETLQNHAKPVSRLAGNHDSGKTSNFIVLIEINLCCFLPFCGDQTFALAGSVLAKTLPWPLPGHKDRDLEKWMHQHPPFTGAVATYARPVSHKHHSPIRSCCYSSLR